MKELFVATDYTQSHYVAQSSFLDASSIDLSLAKYYFIVTV